MDLTDSNIIIEMGASSVLLNSEAFLEERSSKRKLNWSPTTPRGSRGGARKLSQIEASPTLKATLGKSMQVEKKDTNCLAKFVQKIEVSQNHQNKTLATPLF